MRPYFILVNLTLVSLLTIICAASVAATGRHSKGNLPRYRIIHLHLPHGYSIMSAKFTKDGLIVGEITNEQPTENTRDSHGASYAFVWRNGHVKTLPPPPGQARAVAVDMSSDGRLVVGTGMTVYDGAWLWEDSRAVVWQSGRTIQLPMAPGMATSAVYRIEDNGDISGYCRERDHPNPDLPQPISEACRWTTPNYRIQLTNSPLETDHWIESATGTTWLERRAKGSTALDIVHGEIRYQHDFQEEFTLEGINAAGDVVGEKDNPGCCRTTAMLRIMSTGNCVDLNRLVRHRPRGKILTDASAISDTGWIIATLSSKHRGQEAETKGESVLLKPIHE